MKHRTPTISPADVDRLGFLRARIEEHETRIAPDVAEEKALTEKIRGAYAETSPDAMATVEGGKYLLQVGMCTEEQQPLDSPAKAKVLKWIGKDAFLVLAKITFEVLKSALTKEQYGQVVSKMRTGDRRLKVVPKIPAGQLA